MTAQPCKINGLYTVNLLPHRVAFHDARPGWEAERLASMHETVEPGWCIYDLGAESGDFTSLYRKWVGLNGSVVPVEPSPPYWAEIRQTWEANGFKPPWDWFAGFVSDTTDLNPPNDVDAYARAAVDGWPASARWEVQPEFGFRHLAQQADCTPQITIDDLVKRAVYPPDAIVMDIEGAELRALEGAQVTLAERRPVMWVSIHPGTLAEWYGATREDIHALMNWYDYAPTLLGQDSEEYWRYDPL